MGQILHDGATAMEAVRRAIEVREESMTRLIWPWARTRQSTTFAIVSPRRP
jgi:hypothetical protein